MRTSGVLLKCRASLVLPGYNLVPNSVCSSATARASVNVSRDWQSCGGGDDRGGKKGGGGFFPFSPNPPGEKILRSGPRGGGGGRPPGDPPPAPPPPRPHPRRHAKP